MPHDRQNPDGDSDQLATGDSSAGASSPTPPSVEKRETSDASAGHLPSSIAASAASSGDEVAGSSSEAGEWRRPGVQYHKDADPVDLLAYRTLPATQGDLYRLSRLLWVLVLLAAVFIAPSIAARFQYSLTAAKERARLDVARVHLAEFQLDQLRTAYRLLAQSVGPSVVSIQTSGPRGSGQGSGVIVDESGYILTNNHVVDGVDTAEITLSDGRRGPASVIGTDPLVDIALIKTELNGLTPAVWAESDDLEVGDPVWALGSPFGLQKSITSGILSAKERRGITDYMVQEFLQTDAPVNPGNSGGP
ncbi:MAG: trypsin-like peptidase domain-containing protein, partial [Planctomycetales bacterium]|nr:trypsin-like peptidase domain-containing protein [Planctomycetales bacterium]